MVAVKLSAPSASVVVIAEKRVMVALSSTVCSAETPPITGALFAAVGFTKIA